VQSKDHEAGGSLPEAQQPLLSEIDISEWVGISSSTRVSVVDRHFHLSPGMRIIQHTSHEEIMSVSEASDVAEILQTCCKELKAGQEEPLIKPS
jgi:hypothetical protein